MDIILIASVGKVVSQREIYYVRKKLVSKHKAVNVFPIDSDCIAARFGSSKAAALALVNVHGTKLYDDNCTVSARFPNRNDEQLWEKIAFREKVAFASLDLEGKNYHDKEGATAPKTDPKPVPPPPISLPTQQHQLPKPHPISSPQAQGKRHQTSQRQKPVQPPQQRRSPSSYGVVDISSNTKNSQSQSSTNRESQSKNKIGYNPRQNTNRLSGSSKSKHTDNIKIDTNTVADLLSKAKELGLLGVLPSTSTSNTNTSKKPTPAKYTFDSTDDNPLEDVSQLKPDRRSSDTGGAFGKLQELTQQKFTPNKDGEASKQTNSGASTSVTQPWFGKAKPSTILTTDGFTYRNQQSKFKQTSGRSVDKVQDSDRKEEIYVDRKSTNGKQLQRKTNAYQLDEITSGKRQLEELRTLQLINTFEKEVKAPVLVHEGEYDSEEEERFLYGESEETEEEDLYLYGDDSKNEKGEKQEILSQTKEQNRSVSQLHAQSPQQKYVQKSQTQYEQSPRQYFQHKRQQASPMSAPPDSKSLNLPKQPPHITKIPPKVDFDFKQFSYVEPKPQPSKSYSFSEEEADDDSIFGGKLEICEEPIEDVYQHNRSLATESYWSHGEEDGGSPTYNERSGRNLSGDEQYESDNLPKISFRMNEAGVKSRGNQPKERKNLPNLAKYDDKQTKLREKILNIGNSISESEVRREAIDRKSRTSERRRQSIIRDLEELAKSKKGASVSLEDNKECKDQFEDLAIPMRMPGERFESLESDEIQILECNIGLQNNRGNNSVERDRSNGRKSRERISGLVRSRDKEVERAQNVIQREVKGRDLLNKSKSRYSLEIERERSRSRSIERKQSRERSVETIQSRERTFERKSKERTVLDKREETSRWKAIPVKNRAELNLTGSNSCIDIVEKNETSQSTEISTKLHAADDSVAKLPSKPTAKLCFIMREDSSKSYGFVLIEKDDLVVVDFIQGGGPAAQGDLCVGECVVEVDGQSTMGADINKVVECIRNDHRVVKMLVSDEATTRYCVSNKLNVRDVTDVIFRIPDTSKYVTEVVPSARHCFLGKKNKSESFGLSLKQTTSMSTLLWQVDCIEEGLPASHTDIKVGDWILEIGGKPSNSITAVEVMHKLKGFLVINLLVIEESDLKLCMKKELEFRNHFPHVISVSASTLKRDQERKFYGVRECALIKSSNHNNFGVIVETKEIPGEKLTLPYIKDIAPFSPAACCPDVHIGDWIVAINRRSCIDWKKKDVKSVLLEPKREKVSLTLMHTSSLIDLKGFGYEITGCQPGTVIKYSNNKIGENKVYFANLCVLHKETYNESFGLEIRDVNQDGHYQIAAVKDKSPASKCLGINIDDYLIEVNGQRLVDIKLTGFHHELNRKLTVKLLLCNEKTLLYGKKNKIGVTEESKLIDIRKYSTCTMATDDNSACEATTSEQQPPLPVDTQVSEDLKRHKPPHSTIPKEQPKVPVLLHQQTMLIKQQQTPLDQQELQHKIAPYQQLQTTPFPQQTIPDQQQTIPDQQQTSHYKQQQTTPYQQQTTAYQQQATPYQQHATPYQQQATPYQQQTTPYQQQTTPYQQQQQQATPFQQQPITYQQQPIMYQQQTIPQQQQTTPYQQQQQCVPYQQQQQDVRYQQQQQGVPYQQQQQGVPYQQQQQGVAYQQQQQAVPYQQQAMPQQQQNTPNQQQQSMLHTGYPIIPYQQQAMSIRLRQITPQQQQHKIQMARFAIEAAQQAIMRLRPPPMPHPTPIHSTPKEADASTVITITSSVSSKRTTSFPDPTEEKGNNEGTTAKSQLKKGSATDNPPKEDISAKTPYKVVDIKTATTVAQVSVKNVKPPTVSPKSNKNSICSKTNKEQTPIIEGNRAMDQPSTTHSKMIDSPVPPSDNTAIEMKVKGLPNHFSCENLKQLCNKYGEISVEKVISNKEGSKAKITTTVGYIRIKGIENAAAAILGLKVDGYYGILSARSTHLQVKIDQQMPEPPRTYHIKKKKPGTQLGLQLQQRTFNLKQYSVISTLSKGMPAARSGLNVGDYIININGTNVIGAELKRVLELIKNITSRIIIVVVRHKALTFYAKYGINILTNLSTPIASNNNSVSTTNKIEEPSPDIIFEGEFNQKRKTEQPNSGLFQHSDALPSPSDGAECRDNATQKSLECKHIESISSINDPNVYSEKTPLTGTMQHNSINANITGTQLTQLNSNLSQLNETKQHNESMLSVMELETKIVKKGTSVSQTKTVKQSTLSRAYADHANSLQNARMIRPTYERPICSQPESHNTITTEFSKPSKSQLEDSVSLSRNRDLTDNKKTEMHASDGPSTSKSKGAMDSATLSTTLKHNLQLENQNKFKNIGGAGIKLKNSDYRLCIMHRWPGCGFGLTLKRESLRVYVSVESVNSVSPANCVGLSPGDIILEMNDIATFGSSFNPFENILNKHKTLVLVSVPQHLGSRLSRTIGELQTLNKEDMSRVESPIHSPTAKWFRLWKNPINNSFGVAIDIEEECIKIGPISEQSPAYIAGIRQNDVILEINGVHTPSEIASVLSTQVKSDTCRNIDLFVMDQESIFYCRRNKIPIEDVINNKRRSKSMVNVPCSSSSLLITPVETRKRKGSRFNSSDTSPKSRKQVSDGIGYKPVEIIKVPHDGRAV